MSRSRIVFLLIIASAIGLVLVSQVVQRLPVAPTPTPLPKLQIEIAVNPMAYEWVNAQARIYNQQNPTTDGQPIEIRVTSRDGIDVWQSGAVWSTVNHPVAWIPEANFALGYANQTGARFEAITSTVASTPLVWGIFAEQGKLVGSPLDWTTLEPVVKQTSWSALGGNESWGAPKFAMPFPLRSTVGFSVLIDAAANFAKTDQIASQNLTDRTFQTWLQPFAEAVPNFNNIGQRPAQTLASRGASVADFALLPESDWLIYFNQINAQQPVQFAYPAYKLTFDMPFAVWAGSDLTNTQRGAAKSFSDFLVSVNAQKATAAYGLRPASVPLAEADAQLFNAAVVAGISLETPPGTPIVVPTDRNAALGLLDWFRSVRSS
jgi:hypothetical protein